MNQREKEAYLREYALHKAKGKPFFPYAVAKDSIMAALVILVIIMMSLVFGAELGPKADPTTTTYVPRPEWYYYFLFELLRVIKPAILTPLATVGVPNICMVLLFLLPFYDRGPERRPERRPVATAAGIFTIAAMAYLTYLGAAAGSPNEIDMTVRADLEPGKLVVAQSGCLACHKIGENGGDGPGPNLSEVGDRLLPGAIRRTLENPSAQMPSFKNMSPEKKTQVVAFLASLRKQPAPAPPSGPAPAPKTSG
ncbi:MAG: c-type cytochrome [Solirubrobacteraceae bacterium]